MVRISNKQSRVKIIFWGIQGSSKNTPLDILYNITKNKERKDEVEIRFTGEQTRIPLGTIEGFFFDRVVFQSTKMQATFFHVYNMMGDPSFENEMKKMFLGTDGIVFVFSGKQSRWNENVESLSLLKKIAGSKLLEKIPMTVLLTKEDLPNAVSRAQVEQLLEIEGLLQDSGEIQSTRNPVIFEANLGDPTSNDVYKAFAECARRVGMYHIAKVYLKIVFWGIKEAGKNTAVDILFNLTKDKAQKDGVDITFPGEHTKIAFGDADGLFFDRGVFQSTKKDTIFFHVYTFTGDPNVGEKMGKRFFKGTDGIVFVFDGQPAKWDENVASLSVLKKNAGLDLIEKIPTTVLITKTDLPDAVKRSQVEELLKAEGLLRDPKDTRSIWNPVIFEANLRDPTTNDAYKAFAECARRVGMYQLYGGGSAPISEKTSRINLVIPDALKSVWEQFSSDVVHASMSQMIRDAVREYMQNKKQPEQPQETVSEDQAGQVLEKMIERIVAKKLDSILKKS